MKFPTLPHQIRKSQAERAAEADGRDQMDQDSHGQRTETCSGLIVHSVRHRRTEDGGEIRGRKPTTPPDSAALLSAIMSVDPLEGLMSVSRQLVCSSESPAARQPDPRPDPWLPRCGRQLQARQQVHAVELSRTARNQHSPENAARERSRVRNLRQAFRSLQAALPSVPPDTKLSKLDVLVLATNYIAYLTETLDKGAELAEHKAPSRPGGYLHPVKKWPMRSLLYCGTVGELLSVVPANQMIPPGQSRARH